MKIINESSNKVKIDLIHDGNVIGQLSERMIEALKIALFEEMKLHIEHNPEYAEYWVVGGILYNYIGNKKSVFSSKEDEHFVKDDCQIWIEASL